MSWTTGTQTEALSVANVNGTALASSTALTVISPAEGAAYCPANFWLPTYGASKGLLIKAFGVFGTTATPNLTVAVYANTTQGTPATALATTGASAMVASGSNMNWELEVLISNVSTGSSGSFLADGMWKGYDTATALHTYRCSSSAANPNTGVTLSTQSAYYIELAAQWSANSASNTIQVYSYTVLGLN